MPLATLKVVKPPTTKTHISLSGLGGFTHMTSALAMLQTSDENITNIALAGGYD